MIKSATKDDIPRIVAMVKKFHASADQPQEFIESDAVGFVSEMIQSPSAIVLTTEKSVIAGILAQSPINIGWKICFELCWWSEDGKGSLLAKSFMKTALELGANEIRFSCRSSTPEIGNHLERMGFSHDELVYRRVF